MHSYCADFYAAYGYQFLKTLSQTHTIPDNLVIFGLLLNLAKTQNIVFPILI